MDSSVRPPREQTATATAIRTHPAKGRQPQQVGTGRQGRKGSRSTNGQPGCDDEGQSHHRKGLINSPSVLAGNKPGMMAQYDGHGIGAFAAVRVVIERPGGVCSPSPQALVLSLGLFSRERHEYPL